MTTPHLAGPCPCNHPVPGDNPAGADALTVLTRLLEKAIDSAPKAAHKLSPERVKQHLADLRHADNYLALLCAARNNAASAGSRT